MSGKFTNNFGFGYFECNRKFYVYAVMLPHLQSHSTAHIGSCIVLFGGKENVPGHGSFQFGIVEIIGNDYSGPLFHLMKA